MFELVIAIGKNCDIKQVLMTGTYESICEETSKFDSTNDIRNNSKYKMLIDKFLEDKDTNGQIVVLDVSSLNIKKHRVIYKSDVKLFNKIMSIPNRKDAFFKEWINYWRCLRYGMKSKKINPISNKDIETNQKISECDRKFNSNSYLFNKLLNKLPLWYIYSFNPNEPRFYNSFFAKYRNLIKEDLNNYYQLAEIVLSSFDTYEKICRLYGLDCKKMFERYHKIKNYNKNKVKQKMSLKKSVPIKGKYIFDELEFYDELGHYEENNSYIYKNQDTYSREREIFDDEEPDLSYIHSSEYMLLKPYIENRDIEFLKDYLNKYQGRALTNEEYEEIKFLIEEKISVKKR